MIYARAAAVKSIKTVAEDNNIKINKKGCD